jgi:hypothetical protein
MASDARSKAAAALSRATLSLGDEALRATYVAMVVRSAVDGGSAEPRVPRAWSADVLAGALDELCARAERGEAPSREVLVALVDAMNQDGMGAVLNRLREEAVHGSFFALERLVRQLQGPSSRAIRGEEDAGVRQRVPEDDRGRPLTLGERKSLARRPDRETMHRLLADPHPEVIARLLRNPRLTEDDVVRLAAKRPGNQAALGEIARSPKWLHRPRVRMALVFNPATPPDLAARITGLLLRSELELAATSPGVGEALRALCIEHLARRPPLREPDAPDEHQVH